MNDILLFAIIDARTRGRADASPHRDDLDTFTEITKNLPPQWMKAWNLQRNNEIWDAYNEGWNKGLDRRF